MTICIAALSDNCEGCVLGSDQMTTAHFPIGYEFESDEVEKIVEIADATYVLISGDVLFADSVLELVKQKFRDGSIKSISEVAEAVRVAYQEVRKLHVIRTELEPRGLDINSYYQTQQRLVTAIVQMIDQAFRGYNPGVEFIVSGKDSSGCHIYTIQNPGELRRHDAIGFAAIGTGGPHAVYSMIESSYKKSLDKEAVEKLVKKAKTRSEVAPGVGKKTKIVSI